MKNTYPTLKILTIAFAVLFLSATFAQAKIVEDRSFADGEAVDAGTVVSTPGGFGWHSPVADDPKGYGLPKGLIYPVEQVFTGNEGALEFKLTRDNGDQNVEALFAFVDENFNTIKVAQISWKGTFPKGTFPVLFLEGGGPSTRLWHRDYSKPEYGSAKVFIERIPFDREIQVGETFKLVFAWGTNPKVFLNGTELDSLSEDFGLTTLLERTKWIVIGTEPDKDGTIGYSHLRSPLSLFRVYDGAIASVTHNAFSVAGYSGKLVNGDAYTVTLKAEAGGTASFDLGSAINHPMNEDPDNPGTYAGTHAVKYGEDGESEQVTGHFVSAFGVVTDPVAASRPITIDTRIYMDVKASNDLVPADESSRSGLTIVAADANGKAVKDHELKLTLSTTDEYTGTVGGGTFEDLVGGVLDVDWGGITDSFGEVTAQYISGFAAKTILVSAKDMVSGDVGVGYVRSFIDGEVSILVTEPKASALSVAGSMEVSLSRGWLTADGKSRSRLTAVVKNASGDVITGHSIQFTLLGDNGEIRVIQGKTDSDGRAFADYIAGTLMGQVQVEVRDLTSGMVAVVPIELRPDAPAIIELAADPGEVATGGSSTVTAKVTDANGNPNSNVDVLYNIATGEGAVDSPSIATDEEGVASVTFTASDAPGLVTVRGTVISREPTPEEVSAAKGAVFLFGLDEDPGRLDVVEWLVETGDEVVEGQDLVTLEDRAGTVYTVVAPRDGIVSTFVAEERDRVEYGDTLGYVIEVAE